MPAFKFTSPEGKQYTVNGPDGATKEQAFQILQGQISGAAQPSDQSSQIPGNEQALAGNRNVGKPDESSFLDKVTGGLEAARSAVTGATTGALGYIGGALGGIAGSIATGEFGTEQGTRRASEAATDGVARLTYQPQTTKGQEYAGNVADALHASGIVGLPIGPELGAAATLARPAARQAAEALSTEAYIAKNLAQKATQKAAGTVDSVASTAGNSVANVIGELGTHTGGESIKNAYRAGVEGNTTFVDNLRGNVPLTDVLDTAKSNLANMRAAKSAEYRNGMAQVSGDQSVLSFNSLDQALSDALNVGAYKEKVTNKTAQAKMAEVAQVVDDWKNSVPDQYHTPEGFDALKQAIGGVLESIPYEQQAARKAVGQVYHAVRDTIAEQAPVYDDVMKGYQQASEQIVEIERALSLGNKASADTAMRKLQSLTRNNANTNYGNRLDLAQQLEQQGGNDIMPALSGQALSSIAPRGLGKLAAGGTAFTSLSHPMLAAALPFQSPRLMGEAAYAAGRLQSAISAPLARAFPRLAQAMIDHSVAKRPPPVSFPHELALAEESAFAPRAAATPEPQYNGLLHLADDTDPAYAIGGIAKDANPLRAPSGLVPDTERLATRHDAPAIDFPLRQEVLQQPEIAGAIDVFRAEDGRLSKIVDNAISRNVRAKAELDRDGLRQEFSNGMRELGIENPADAHGLNRPLYDAGSGTRLPIERTLSPAERNRLAVDNVAGQPIDHEWTAFAPDSGTLNVDRAAMPQIKAEHRGAMVNFLNARGIAHQMGELPAAFLKPTQREFSRAKVQQARDYQGGERSILVSSDNHVLDGHHQWLAKLADNAPVKVIQLGAPIHELMQQVKAFPSAETAASAAPDTAALVQHRNLAIADYKAAAHAGDEAGAQAAEQQLARAREALDAAHVKVADQVQGKLEQAAAAPAKPKTEKQARQQRTAKGGENVPSASARTEPVRSADAKPAAAAEQDQPGAGAVPAAGMAAEQPAALAATTAQQALIDQAVKTKIITPGTLRGERFRDGILDATSGKALLQQDRSYLEGHAWATKKAAKADPAKAGTDKPKTEREANAKRAQLLAAELDMTD